MPRYLITWSLCGSTFIEATSQEDAQAKFDKIPAVELEEGELDFVQHEMLIETSPGCFEDV